MNADPRPRICMNADPRPRICMNEGVRGRRRGTLQRAPQLYFCKYHKIEIYNKKRKKGRKYIQEVTSCIEIEMESKEQKSYELTHVKFIVNRDAHHAVLILVGAQGQKFILRIL